MESLQNGFYLVSFRQFSHLKRFGHFLHDSNLSFGYIQETYGNVPSSSSDDEDWSDTTAPRKRKKCNAEAASAPPNGNAYVGSSHGLKQNPEETEHKPRRKTQQKSNYKDTDLSSAELQGGASASGSSGKKAGLSTYKRLGEAVKQVNMVSYMTLINQEQEQKLLYNQAFVCESSRD